MSFSIEWHPHAFDFLEKLPVHISERILKKIEIIKEEPFRFLEHYEGEYYKLRIGDYRLLFDVKNHTLKCMACLVLEHAQDLFLLSHELK